MSRQTTARLGYILLWNSGVTISLLSTGSRPCYYWAPESISEQTVTKLESVTTSPSICARPRSHSAILSLSISIPNHPTSKHPLWPPLPTRAPVSPPKLVRSIWNIQRKLLMLSLQTICWSCHTTMKLGEGIRQGKFHISYLPLFLYLRQQPLTKFIIFLVNPKQASKTWDGFPLP